MDPHRIQAIQEWPVPTSFRDIQVFLGFCNFYQRFILGFAFIARPSHLLLRGIKNGRKDGKIGHNWQKPQQEAFKQLISAFTIAPILWYYNPALPLCVETDASDFALAAIIS